MGAEHMEYPATVSYVASDFDIALPSSYSTRFCPRSLDVLVWDHILQTVPQKDVVEVLRLPMQYLREQNAYLRIAIPARGPLSGAQLHKALQEAGMQSVRWLQWVEDNDTILQQYTNDCSGQVKGLLPTTMQECKARAPPARIASTPEAALVVDAAPGTMDLYLHMYCKEHKYSMRHRL